MWGLEYFNFLIIMRTIIWRSPFVPWNSWASTKRSVNKIGISLLVSSNLPIKRSYHCSDRCRSGSPSIHWPLWLSGEPLLDFSTFCIIWPIYIVFIIFTHSHNRWRYEWENRMNFRIGGVRRALSMARNKLMDTQVQAGTKSWRGMPTLVGWRCKMGLG